MKRTPEEILDDRVSPVAHIASNEIVSFAMSLFGRGLSSSNEVLAASLLAVARIAIDVLPEEGGGERAVNLFRKAMEHQSE